jgi:hypothetical protein
MSDLNARIAQWRGSLAARLSGAELDELEDHLRETLAGLADAPLTVDEQFLIAGRRLGAPGLLVEEYAKADPSRVWQARVFWMLAGWAGIGLVGSLVGCLAQGVALTAWNLGVSANLAALGMFGAEVAAWLLVAWLLAALARGNDRGVQVVAERAARLPRFVKGLVVVAAALVLLGLPGSILMMVRAYTMPVREFGSVMYASNIANLVLHVVVTMGLFAAMLWLTGRQRRRAAAGRA